MNVDELRDLLRRKPVPEDAFVLDGSLVNEAYVLGQEGREWTVYYSERGERTGERRFDSEDAACAEMLRRLRSAFAFDDE